MPKGTLTFKLRDARRALRAARDEGVVVDRYEIDRDGTIRVFADRAVQQIPAASDTPEKPAEVA